MFIEAGTSGIHIRDQKPGQRTMRLAKCSPRAVLRAHTSRVNAQNDEARKMFIENDTASIHIEDPKPSVKNDGVCRMSTEIGAASVHIMDQRPGTANDEVRKMFIENGAAGSMRASIAPILDILGPPGLRPIDKALKMGG